MWPGLWNADGSSARNTIWQEWADTGLMGCREWRMNRSRNKTKKKSINTFYHGEWPACFHKPTACCSQVVSVRGISADTIILPWISFRHNFLFVNILVCDCDSSMYDLGRLGFSVVYFFHLWKLLSPDSYFYGAATITINCKLLRFIHANGPQSTPKHLKALNFTEKSNVTAKEIIGTEYLPCDGDKGMLHLRLYACSI